MARGCSMDGSWPAFLSSALASRYAIVEGLGAIDVKVFLAANHAGRDLYIAEAGRLVESITRLQVSDPYLMGRRLVVPFVELDDGPGGTFREVAPCAFLDSLLGILAVDVDVVLVDVPLGGGADGDISLDAGVVERVVEGDGAAPWSGRL